MAINNVPEFLFENSFRSFPFEDSSELQSNFKFSSILDLKGFSKYKIDDKVKLFAVSRWNTGGARPSVASSIDPLLTEGMVQVFFKFSDLLYISVNVPTGTSSFPLVASSSKKNLEDTVFINLSVIFGESILTEASPGEVRYFTNVTVEPSQIFNLYKVSLNELKIEHANSSIEYVSGDVKFSPGQNTTAMLSGGQGISLSSRKGAGEGNSVSTDPNLVCDGITSVNGLEIQSDGVFRIQGEKNIVVEDDPSNHRVLIYINRDSNLYECRPNEEDAP
jgi:hypothetical protein